MLQDLQEPHWRAHVLQVCPSEELQVVAEEEEHLHISSALLNKGKFLAAIAPHALIGPL